MRIAEQYASDRKLRAPKSSESIRKLKIDANLLETLASWKNAQAQLLGITSEEQDDLPVISDTNGGLLDPDNYSRWFKSFCVKHNFGMWVDDKGNEIVERCNTRGFPVDANGVPYSRSNKRPKRHYKGLKLHELRHTQATQLIASGVDLKTVQHRLGHASATLTMNQYAHALEESDRNASNVIELFMSPDSTQPGMGTNGSIPVKVSGSHVAPAHVEETAETEKRPENIASGLGF